MEIDPKQPNWYLGRYHNGDKIEPFARLDIENASDSLWVRTELCNWRSVTTHFFILLLPYFLFSL